MRLPLLVERKKGDRRRNGTTAKMHAPLHQSSSSIFRIELGVEKLSPPRHIDLNARFRKQRRHRVGVRRSL